MGIANPGLPEYGHLPSSAYSKLKSHPPTERGGTTMTLNYSLSFERFLESAVVASWPDLLRASQRGLVHIEYGFAPSGILEYLQVWSCVVRGHWLLACEYKRMASEVLGTGVHFHNGYESEDLAGTLELVVFHQEAFILPQNPGRAGLLQITTPTQKQSAVAAVSVKEAFDWIHSAPLELALA